MKPEQLTAWALNELSPEEQAKLEAALRENAEVHSQAAQTKQFCEFLTRELRDESLALEDEQRERLTSAMDAAASPEALSKRIAGPVAVPVPGRRRSRRRNVLISLAAAAAVAVVSFLGLMELDEQKQPAATAEIPPSQTVPASPEEEIARAAPVPELGRELAGTINPGDKDEVVRLMALKDTSPATIWSGLALAHTGDAFAGANLDVGYDSRYYYQGRADMAPGATRIYPERDSPGKAGEGSLALNGGTTYGGATMPGNRSEMIGSLTHGPDAEGAKSMPHDLIAGTVGGTEAASSTSPARPVAPYVDSIVETPAARRAGVRMLGNVGETLEERPAPAQHFSFVPLKDARLDRPHLEPHLRPAQPTPANTESYTRIIENALTDVSREPLSTFSIDVDTAAYANVRRFLNQNTAPPRDAVRIEELINYFPSNEEGPPANAAEPFAVKVEMAECPWQPQHQLARIAIKGRDIGKDQKPSNLVFLVDVSGSMNQPNKLPLVKQSLRMLTERLGEGDTVAMVTYAGGTSVVLPPTNGDNKREILAAIDRLQPGGSTHGSAGIQLAYQQAVSGFIKGGVNRVILCTDGDFNVGVSSPEELETLITEKARSGVFLSVLGYGAGNLKDRTMETLADKGNGNYAYIDSLSEARKVLVEQMSGTLVTIAKDVKIQVEFNPAAVRSYRLIGYENRLLAKEDFNDDRKDAGEIGAGHSVTALYELVPANLPPGTGPRPPVDGLKYQTQTAAPPPPVLAEPAHSGEAMTVKLRYKDPEGSTSRLLEVPVKNESRPLAAASEEFKFTTAVAGFGLLLRESSYAGVLSWEQVRQLALEGKGSDPLGYRGEFLQLIEKASGLEPARK